MPPPVPPSVNDGRMIAGKPGALEDRFGLVEALGDAAGGDARGRCDASPRRTACDPRRWRSRRAVAPISSTPYFSSAPDSRQRHRDVERRLAAHRRENRVRPLLLDDQLDELRRHRLDVRPIRELRIGHDRRRVRVDENDLVALFLQRLRRLRAGVIELGGLPDDDRAGADHENAVQVSSSRHSASRR